jgi:hypothetical protein
MISRRNGRIARCSNHIIHIHNNWNGMLLHPRLHQQFKTLVIRFSVCEGECERVVLRICIVYIELFEIYERVKAHAETDQKFKSNVNIHFSDNCHISKGWWDLNYKALTVGNYTYFIYLFQTETVESIMYPTRYCIWLTSCAYNLKRSQSNFKVLN